MQRIRQKDIAEALGLDRSTVSKALKGDPAIAASTREQVRQAAERLGFRPDPMLSALAQYRKREPSGYRATIAWIYNYPKSTDMSLYAGHGNYFKGAAGRCLELGYKLEPFWVDGRLTTTQNLPRILTARGIQAVIFAPQATVGVRLEFPIESFCALTIGYSLTEPKMDVVTNDHFTTMTEILDRLRLEGHERIGCYLWENDNERMGRRARSAFLAYSQDFTCSVETYREFDSKAFSAWIKETQPDAVVSRGNEQAKVVCTINRRNRGVIRFAGYAIESCETALSGMSHNNYQIGVRAAEWISSKLERGQFGSPEVPQRLLIAGKWVDNG
jgi:DNA-binding LacI/PurR family transcriptional regulator